MAGWMGDYWACCWVGWMVRAKAAWTVEKSACCSVVYWGEMRVESRVVMTAVLKGVRLVDAKADWRAAVMVDWKAAWRAAK